jgi:hypothetical protein
MVDFGLSYKDWTRIGWTFLMGFGAFALAAANDWVGGQPFSAKAFIIGGLAAGFSLVKNFTLADTSPIK